MQRLGLDESLSVTKKLRHQLADRMDRFGSNNREESADIAILLNKIGRRVRI